MGAKAGAINVINLLPFHDWTLVTSSLIIVSDFPDQQTSGGTSE